MASFYGSQFDKALRRLRAAMPCNAKVRTVPASMIKGRFADETHYGDGRHLIQIARNLSISDALDSLAHGWAHAVDLDRKWQRKEEHRVSWGALYAQAYRLVMQDDKS